MSRDHVDQKVLEDIEKHGWCDMAIFPTRPGEGERWNYSVGLIDTYGHAELCVVGLEQQQAHSFLWSAVNLIKTGTTLAPNTYVEQVIEHFPVAMVEVDNLIGDEFPLSMVHRFYGMVPANQMVWPDMNGHFPWDAGFDERYRPQQPLLGEWGGPHA